MKTCPNCGAQMNDDAMFCTRCGMAQGADSRPQTGGGPDQQYNQYRQYNQNQQYYQNSYVPPANPYDHTAEFDREDIAKNKLFCMLVYLGSILGIIVALLATSKEKSAYTDFHIRQGIKLFVTEAIILIITVILSWTVVFLVAGIICLVICIIIDLIAFVQVCMGKAKELPIIRKFTFLGR